MKALDELIIAKDMIQQKTQQVDDLKMKIEQQQSQNKSKVGVSVAVNDSNSSSNSNSSAQTLEQTVAELIRQQLSLSSSAAVLQASINNKNNINNNISENNNNNNNSDNNYELQQLRQNERKLTHEVIKYQKLYESTRDQLYALKEDYTQNISFEQARNTKLISELSHARRELEKPVTPQLQQFLVSE